MTVRELIEKLQQEDPEAVVTVSVRTYQGDFEDEEITEVHKDTYMAYVFPTPDKPWSGRTMEVPAVRLSE